MPTHNIVVLPGDHVGPEVIAEAMKLLKAITQARPDINFNFNECKFGGASIDAHGTPLTSETLAACKAADAVLLGSIGGPEWPPGPIRPEHGLLTLRKEMNTFGNLRPCSFAAPSLLASSPLKESVARGTNFTVVRELVGGMYFGPRTEDTGDGVASDLEIYHKWEVERIVRLAAYMALLEDPPAKVWSLDKANVLASSRMWRTTVDEVMKAEFPQLKYEHQLIDSAAMDVVARPTKLNGVVVTSNMFGDIISDEASVIPGSIGLLPSASLSGIPDGKSKANGIYEPCHGSAPDISGQNKVNPVAMLLSTAMMFKYSLQLPDMATVIEKAVEIVIESGVKTPDIGGKNTTAEVGDAVVVEVTKLLKT